MIERVIDDDGGTRSERVDTTARPGQCRRDFGFTWGKTDEMVWIRNDDRSYKRIDPNFLETLSTLAEGECDPATMDPEILRDVDRLAEEGYLDPGGDIRQYGPPPDIRLWPRLAILGILTVVTGALMAVNWSAIWSPPGSVTGTILVVSFFVVATLLHEFGHWAACRPYFRASFGIGRRNGVIPAIVTRTNESWRLPRNIRIWITLAGPFVDVVVCLGLAIAFVLAPGQGLLGTLLLVQLFRLLIVLNPLVGGDGYWLLVDVFGTHDLRPHAFADLKRGRMTGPAVYAASMVVFTVAFVVASAYFLMQLIGST